MSRLDRLTAELLFLQERPRTCEEIADEFRVSKRTVIRDMQALVEMGVPVASKEGVAGGYSLAVEHTLAPLHLTWQEAVLLMLAMSSISKLGQSPYAASRSSLIAKLRAMLPARQRERVTEMLQKLEMEIPRRTQETPYLEDLLAASLRSEWLLLTYAGEKGITQLRVQAMRVYADRGFWYLEGLSRGQRRMYRVDRITRFEPAEPEDHPEIPYDHPSHPTVKVRLTERGIRAVERDPHLGSTVHRKEDGGADLEFRCPPSELDWYARYFGGLGEDAIVSGPPELVEAIRTRASNILQIYSER